MNRGEPAEEHRRFEEMAVAHVLGGLDDTDGRVFRAHLLECSTCRARVGELRALAHDLADVERDERRLRAAKAVETKKRKQEGEAEDESPRKRARSRLVPIMVILAVMSLAAWNFTLRGNVERLESSLEASLAAAAVLEFGEAGEVLLEAQGVRGQLKAEGGTLVVLLDGLSDDLIYGLYVMGARAQVLYRRPAEPTRGRLFLMIPLPEAGTTLLVTAPPQGGPGSVPSGHTIFEARIPVIEEAAEHSELRPATR